MLTSSGSKLHELVSEALGSTMLTSASAKAGVANSTARSTPMRIPCTLFMLPVGGWRLSTATVGTHMWWGGGCRFGKGRVDLDAGSGRFSSWGRNHRLV